jgi:hypothetical protein
LGLLSQSLIRREAAALALATLLPFHAATAEVPVAVVTMGGHSAADQDGTLQALSAAIQKPVGLHNTDHFDVLHTLDNAWAAELGSLLENYYSAFLDTSKAAGFAVRAPRRHMTWVCLDDPASYDAYAATFELDGEQSFGSYFSPRTDRVILLSEFTAAEDLNRSIRVAHETAHQLAYGSGLQARGVMYPLWVSEGLATSFEEVLLSGERFGSDRSSRREALATASRAGDLRPLSRFVLMTEAPPDGPDRDAFYAQAWAFVRFLHTREPAVLSRYLAMLAQMDSGRRPQAALLMEFEQAFGDPNALEPAWSDFVASLGSDAHGTDAADAAPVAATTPVAGLAKD